VELTASLLRRARERPPLRRPCCRSYSSYFGGGLPSSWPKSVQARRRNQPRSSTRPAEGWTRDSVNAALEKLARVDPEKAELVTLKFFVGLTYDEIGETLNISVKEAGKQWNYARDLLQVEIEKDGTLRRRRRGNPQGLLELIGSCLARLWVARAWRVSRPRLGPSCAAKACTRPSRAGRTRSRKCSRPSGRH